MPYVISFVTQKGGSGKSTLAINCAVAASQGSKRALLLDLDAQRTADIWAQARHKLGLTEPEVMRIEPGKIDMALDVAKEMKFDWVLIDTPGQESPGTAAAIRAADLCVIPCRPTPADIQAVPPTLEVIKRLEKPAVFVLTQTPPRSYRISEAEETLRQAVAVSPVYIVSRTAYQDAQGLGYGVTEYDGEGKAAEEIRELWRWIAARTRKATNG
jgi:chromosome partitioning protein